MKISRNDWITIAGIALAILNAWQNVDWKTFQLDYSHIMPLVISSAIAFLGKIINLPPRRKKNENKANT